MTYDIQLKRLYRPVEKDDGARILVDRLWPRGKRRDSLDLTDWYRDASPTPGLRRNYHQKAISHDSFADHYRREFGDAPENLLPLMCYARRGRLTLLTASRDIQASHLPLLREAILEALHEEDATDNEPSSPPCYLGQMKSS